MKRLLIITAIIMSLAACKQTNPFLTEWDTPYGIPPFDQIENRHYVPAVEKGITKQTHEIDAILATVGEPSFENTVAAYEHTGEMLEKVTGVLFNLSETESDAPLNRVVERVIPLLSEHRDNIYMNPYFFSRVKYVYDKKDELELTSEQKRVLDKMYKSFVDNGVNLNEEGQARMREINKELSTLEYNFTNCILAENNAFAEKFGVAVSEYDTEMAKCADRDRRQAMYEAYSTRGAHGGKNDTRKMIIEIMRLRQEKAALLGYDCPANYFLSDEMAANAHNVDVFMDTIINPAIRAAKMEVAKMQEIMDEDVAEGLLPDDSTSVIRPWDWSYYAERVRAREYELNEDDVRPYFKMENVREGVFNTAHKLYGMNFEKIDSVSLYHPDVEAFRVTDSDGSLLGVLLTDYFPRKSKRGGAWMNNFRDQYKNKSGEDVRPIIVNVGNFAKPTADKPSLLTIDEVETMFHEFGHAIHGLLSKCNYPSVSGTSVSRDFVEFLSQVNENWAFAPEVLKSYAFHYETGEPIPDELIEKINAAAKFNQGFKTTELAAAAILDMKWHELTSVEVPEDCPYGKGGVIDPVLFDQYVCEEMGLIDEIIPRYHSTYFNHVFGGGYAAGYYSYLWSEVLDKDAFELFRKKGIFDKATATSFRQNILEKGDSEDPMVLYRRFRGKDPDPAALLRARGLIEN